MQRQLAASVPVLGPVEAKVKKKDLPDDYDECVFRINFLMEFVDANSPRDVKDAAMIEYSHLLYRTLCLRFNPDPDHFEFIQMYETFQVNMRNTGPIRNMYDDLWIRPVQEEPRLSEQDPVSSNQVVTCAEESGIPECDFKNVVSDSSEVVTPPSLDVNCEEVAVTAANRRRRKKRKKKFSQVVNPDSRTTVVYGAGQPSRLWTTCDGVLTDVVIADKSGWKSSSGHLRIEKKPKWLMKDFHVFKGKTDPALLSKMLGAIVMVPNHSDPVYLVEKKPVNSELLASSIFFKKLEGLYNKGKRNRHDYFMSPEFCRECHHPQ